MPRTGDTYNLPAGGAVAGTEAKADDVVTPLADLAAEQNLVRPISAGGTGASTTSAARAALGLAIGSNVQAYDAGLDSISGLPTAADKAPYLTGPDTYALADQTPFARTLLDDADAATARGTLGLVIGTDVQAHDASLDDLAGITFSAGDILYHDGTNLVRLVKGTDGQFLRLASGIPSWAADDGPPTSLHAVGTHLWAKATNAVLENATCAGSNLAGARLSSAGSTFTSGSTTPPGTWRALAEVNATFTGLFVRVS